MERKADIFYYSDLFLFNRLLEHKSPPFIKYKIPNFAVIKSTDNILLFVDFDELFNLRILTEIEREIICKIKNILIQKSEVNDKFIRIYYDTYNYTPCWKKLCGIAVGFVSNLVCRSEIILNCTPIKYNLFTNELLKAGCLVDPISDFFNTLCCPLVRDANVSVKIQVKDHNLLNYFETYELNNSLVDVCWEKGMPSTVDLYYYDMKPFIIGPNTNLDRNELSNILFYYGLHFEPTNINEYIWKLSYQFPGLERDWSDVYNQ